mmetsp:Transcript_899/g.3731  ORF Transcript_899/g.3731 Transcript_899/m.3731 type:complete len:214 (+) Transcript_899:543-1184(+)
MAKGLRGAEPEPQSGWIRGSSLAVDDSPHQRAEGDLDRSIIGGRRSFGRHLQPRPDARAGQTVDNEYMGTALRIRVVLLVRAKRHDAPSAAFKMSPPAAQLRDALTLPLVQRRSRVVAVAKANKNARRGRIQVGRHDRRHEATFPLSKLLRRGNGLDRLGSFQLLPLRVAERLRCQPHHLLLRVHHDRGDRVSDGDLIKRTSPCYQTEAVRQV